MIGIIGAMGVEINTLANLLKDKNVKIEVVMKLMKDYSSEEVKNYYWYIYKHIKQHIKNKTIYITSEDNVIPLLFFIYYFLPFYDNLILSFPHLYSQYLK